MRYVFADCVLDTTLAILHRAGRDIPLRPKVFHLLQYLLEQRVHLVTKDVLCTQVWPGQYISDAALEGCIKLARQAIGDSGRAQRLIQTRRGYGYRFVGSVEEQAVGHTEQIGTAPGESLAPPAMVPLEPTPVRPEPTLPSGESEASPAGAGEVALRWSVTGVAAGERKLVTLLGCTLVRDASLCDRDQLGLDALHSQMRALYALARSEMAQYGGTLQHVTGDRFMALFGVPVAQEDHARRAVLAALGLLQQVVAQWATPGASPEAALAVRIGLHTGLVAVGGIGDVAEVAVAVVGDTATLAAALQEHAAPGMILCSDTTARLVQAVVDVEAVGPMPGGGQSTPVMAYKVLGRRRQRARVAPHEAQPWSRFVGRSRELVTLLALLAQVEDGQGHVVGIMGDPGIGKSRLLEEFRQRLVGRRLTYLRGRCLSYSSATPYLPVLDLLRQHCGITDADSPEVMTAKVHRGLQEVGMTPEAWAPYVMPLLGLEPGVESLVGLSPQAIKARTFEALVQMSVHSSRQRPLVLEVEDLHWIDATSEEWLAALVERIARVPILLLVSYRPGYQTRWMDKSYATQLTLRPLTPSDSRQVLQAVLHTEQVSESLVQAILARADGNPFFLEELARTVVEQDARHPSLAVPDTIHAVLAARIDRLPPAPKGLLQAASVIGQEVTLPLLQTLVGLADEELQRGLWALQAAEFVYETCLVSVPTYSFKHVLTQEVAYQSLLHSTRVQYHRQIAQIIEERWPELAAAQPELVAHHFAEAGLNSQAVGYWQRAGRLARARSAHPEAITHLTKGLELLQTLPETPERIQQELALLLSLGSSLLTTEGYASATAERTYVRARELCQHAGDTTQLARALFALWGLHNYRAELQPAHALGQQLLALAQRVRHPPFFLLAHYALGNTLCFLGKLVSARAHLEQGMALAVSMPHHAPSSAATVVARTATYCQASWTLLLLGYADQALQRSSAGLALAQAHAHPHSMAIAMFYTAVLHQFRQEWQEVQEHAETLIALASEQGLAYWKTGGMFLRGWVLTMQGQEEEGRAQMDQGMAVWSTGAAVAWPYFLALLAETYRTGEQPEEGLRVLAAALAAVGNSGVRWWEAELHRLMGEIPAQAGGLRGASGGNLLPVRSYCGSPPAGQSARTAGGHEPGSPLAAAGQTGRSLRVARPNLWLVHRGL